MSLRLTLLLTLGATLLPGVAAAQTHGPDRVTVDVNRATTTSGVAATQVMIHGAGADTMARAGLPHAAAWICYSTVSTGVVTCYQWFDDRDGRILDTWADPIVGPVVEEYVGSSGFVQCSAAGACVLSLGNGPYGAVMPPTSEWDGSHPPAGYPVGFNLWTICEGYADQRGPEHHPDDVLWSRCAITGLTNVLPLPDASIDSMAYDP